VFVFDLSGNTWTQLGQLRGNDTVATASFGTSLAATQGWLAVGAPGDGTKQTGLVYMFKPSPSDTTTGWALYQTVTPTVTNIVGQFGYSLDVSNGVLIVGDPTNSKFMVSKSTIFAHCLFNNAGQAYIYEYQPLNNAGWVLDQLLSSTSNDYGTSATLSINAYSKLALVGAPGANSAYVYFLDGTNWALQQQLTVAGSVSQQYAYDGVIQNGTILLGATGENNDVGAVFAYNARQTTYTPTTSPTAGAPTFSPTRAPTSSGVWDQTNFFTMTADSYFGQSCSLSPFVEGTVFAVVGMPQYGGTGIVGEIEVYSSSTLSSWTAQGYVEPQDMNAGSMFGLSSASNAEFLLVGAPYYGKIPY
jgi:hypothetical protein